MTFRTGFTHILSLRSGLPFLVLLLLLSPWADLQAQNSLENTADDVHTAILTIDGHPLFELRGIKSYPASDRVKQVRSRIIAVAKDESFAVDQLVVKDEDNRSTIHAGDTSLVNIFDLDAELEGIDKHLLAQVIRAKIMDAIVQFRHDRSSAVLLTNSAYGLGLTGAA